MPRQPTQENYETKLLGTLLCYGSEIPSVLETVLPEYFTTGFHNKVYSAMLECYENNDPIEILTIDEKLGNSDRMRLMDLSEQAGIPSNLPFYAEKVREGYLREQLQITCRWAIEEARKGEELDGLLDNFEGKIFSLAEKRTQRSAVAIKDIVPAAYDRIVDGKKNQGISTGFYDLDELTGGFIPGDNIVIAGRPSMGKSAFVISCMARWATENIPSAILTLETTKEQIVNRLLSIHSRIPLHRIRMSRLTHEEVEKLGGLCEEIHEWPIYIDDSFGMSTLELKAKARRLVAKYHPKVLAIDYLQLIHGSYRHASRNEEVGEISHTIQGLAKELNIPILSVSQLSRRTEQREDKRPGLSDLRDSGSIEQDATSVIFIYRPAAYKIRTLDGKPTDNLAILDIAKQKDGPTGEFKLTFLKDYALFENHSDFSTGD